MRKVQPVQPNQWLLLITVALSFYGMGNIWLVQLSSYRLWAYVGPREFQAYHIAWWRSIWAVVLAPAGLVFLASMLMLWMCPLGVPVFAVWLGFALQLFIVLGTAIWWGPLMSRLADPQTGLILPLYRQLMVTHWIRVALVTGYSLLALWMLVESILLTHVHD
jgi:hypothetical protein